MAEIDLSPDEGLEEQTRAVLEAAGDLAWDVHWNPRPNKPWGGVLVVPDEVADRLSATQAATGRRGRKGGSA
jgi:hypothetical protein